MKKYNINFSQQTVKQIEDKFKNSLMRSILAKLLSNKKNMSFVTQQYVSSILYLKMERIEWKIIELMNNRQKQSFT